VSRILLERFSDMTVTLIEPDETLRNRAKLEITGAAADRMSILGMTFQEAAQTDIFNQRSIIFCHGVAGWLEEPAHFLNELVKLAKQSLSPLSLLVGQYSGHLANLAIAGELDKISTLFSASSRRFPSSHSVDGVYQFSESELLKIIDSAGGEVKDILGVRILTDLAQETRNISREELFLLEQQARQLPELRPLANMLHVIVTF